MPTNDYLPYLQHHGILGMKWGVRRYQNADGSLTSAGRRRYGKMSDKKLEKSLKKQIYNQRGKLHGYGRRWEHTKSIGPRSEKEQRLQEKLYEKEASKNGLLEKRQKLDDLQSHWEDYIDSPEQEKKYYDTEKKLLKETEKIDAIDKKYGRYRVIGEPYSKEFINGAGARLSIAKLMDLGYNKKTAEEFVSRLAKSKRTIGAY